jgi:hypothetical protein
MNITDQPEFVKRFPWFGNMIFVLFREGIVYIICCLPFNIFAAASFIFFEATTI